MVSSLRHKTHDSSTEKTPSTKIAHSTVDHFPRAALYGLFGILNVEGAANLSDVTYSGSNSDLLGIRNGSDQTVVLTFQFSPLTEHTLTGLMTPGQVNSTSYSGSLSSSGSLTVPEPSSCMLLVMAGLGLLASLGERGDGRHSVTKHIHDPEASVSIT